MLKNTFIAILITISAFLLNSCANTGHLFGQAPSSTVTYPPSRAQLTDDAFWQGNTNQIWGQLQHVALETLQSNTSQAEPSRAAWIQLAIISKRDSQVTKQLIQNLQAWRTTYPNHPGNALFADNATLNNLMNTALPAHIALLLPLQGPMGANGQAVRDGFLNAYYSSLGKTHIQQTIAFYDTSRNPNISALYQQAISEGADIVIGPLIKENVQTLLKSGSFSKPTLALNYSDLWFGSLPKNFYEFGLSPIDEAQQVADRAWQEGHAHALMIAPQTPWGQRVSNTLISRWQSMGGSISDAYYFSAQADFTKDIAKLLRVNTANEKNNADLNQRHRRQDFDVIFLLAEPEKAREIIPLLRYYFADNVPIYSTSAIYSGISNPSKDTDLNGVTFCDIPWVLEMAHRDNRLYAVGHDAYLVSNNLPRLTFLSNFPLYATTGALTLSSAQQIYRRLSWAKFHDGHP